MAAAPALRADRSRALWTVAFRGLLGLGLGAVIASFLTFARPTSVPPPDLRVHIQRWQVSAAGEDPVPFTEGKFWLVHLLPGEGVPDMEYQFSEWPIEGPAPGGLIAIFWRDPHRGCSVPWNVSFPFGGSRGWFRHPCHGEVYSKAGLQVHGASPRSLDTMELRVNSGGSVVVFPERITLGGPDNASRAVRYDGALR